MRKTGIGMMSFTLDDGTHVEVPGEAWNYLVVHKLKFKTANSVKIFIKENENFIWNWFVKYYRDWIRDKMTKWPASETKQSLEYYREFRVNLIIERILKRTTSGA
jgi:hypothetical protein